MNRQEYQRQWREKNKEKIKAYQKEYRKENREVLLKKMSEYGKKWYQNNKERNLERGRKWQRNNRKRAVEIVQKYVRKHEGKVKEYRKRYEGLDNSKYRLIRYRHAQRWMSDLITFEDYQKLIQKPCNYCGQKNKTKGIDRINNKIGYIKENSVSCCKLCNYMKNKYSVEEFLNHINRIYKHNC